MTMSKSLTLPLLLWIWSSSRCLVGGASASPRSCLRPVLDLNPRFVSIRAGGGGLDVVEPELIIDQHAHEDVLPQEEGLMDLSEYMETCLVVSKKTALLVRIALYKLGVAYYKACKRACRAAMEPDQGVLIESQEEDMFQKVLVWSKKAYRCAKRSTVAFWKLDRDEEENENKAAIQTAALSFFGKWKHKIAVGREEMDESDIEIVLDESEEEEEDENTSSFFGKLKGKRASKEIETEEEKDNDERDKETEEPKEEPARARASFLGNLKSKPKTEEPIKESSSAVVMATPQKKQKSLVARMIPGKKVMMGALIVAISFVCWESFVKDDILPKAAVAISSLRASTMKSRPQEDIVPEDILEENEGTPKQKSQKLGLPWQKPKSAAAST